MTNCANPRCATPLKHLEGGRIYQFEVKSYMVPGQAGFQNPVDRKKLSRSVWRFWLCGRCSGDLTLEFNQFHGLEVSPLRRPASMSLLNPQVLENRGSAWGSTCLPEQ